MGGSEKAVAENLWRALPDEAVTDCKRLAPNVHSVDARPSASVSTTLSLTEPLPSCGVKAT